MKVLLDENLPHELRHFLSGHDVFTVGYMRWNGRSNGDLPSAAAGEAFDVLITNDSDIEYQQDLGELRVSILLIEAPTNKIEHIWPLMAAIERALAFMGPRTFARVSDFL